MSFFSNRPSIVAEAARPIYRQAPATRAPAVDRQDFIQTQLAAFDRAFPGVVKGLSDAASWSDFARSLCESLAKYGSLTERQLAAAQNMLAKVAARETAKAAQPAKSGAVDAGAIVALFDKASSSGLKRPVFRTEAFDLSLAPAGGKNPGAIYVKKGSTYLGKIAGGQFSASRDAGPETHKMLAEVAADPLKVAVSYGRLTGSCCCCGRELTDPVSVEMGIGPICAGKWGIAR